jgi:RNase P subunit RPR2
VIVNPPYIHNNSSSSNAVLCHSPLSLPLVFTATTTAPTVPVVGSSLSLPPSLPLPPSVSSKSASYLDTPAESSDKKEKRKKETEMKEVTCYICQKVLSTKTNLKRHVNSVHNNLRPFSCPHCCQTFHLKQHLKQHLLTHN